MHIQLTSTMTYNDAVDEFKARFFDVEDAQILGGELIEHDGETMWTLYVQESRHALVTDACVWIDQEFGDVRVEW